MRSKVGLHREAIWFLRHSAKQEEREAFYAQLGRVRQSAPALIENSEAIHDPKLSRYMLRFFRFANCIAVFETNRERTLIRVRACQRASRKRAEGQGQRDKP